MRNLDARDIRDAEICQDSRNGRTFVQITITNENVAGDVVHNLRKLGLDVVMD